MSKQLNELRNIFFLMCIAIVTKHLGYIAKSLSAGLFHTNLNHITCKVIFNLFEIENHTVRLLFRCYDCTMFKTSAVQEQVKKDRHLEPDRF